MRKVIYRANYMSKEEKEGFYMGFPPNDQGQMIIEEKDGRIKEIHCGLIRFVAPTICEQEETFEVKFEATKSPFPESSIKRVVFFELKEDCKYYTKEGIEVTNDMLFNHSHSIMHENGYLILD